MWLWNSGTLAYTHQPFITPPNIDTNDQFGRIKMNPAYGMHDMNFSLDDGSVHMLRNIRQFSEKITLSRKGGSWGWAWILPNPANF